MKLGILGSFCLVAAISSPAVAESWTDQMIETKKIDFGVIAAGSEARKLVEIKNVYDATVQISEVKTTCGCSAANTGNKTIAPGETGTVEVKMNTYKFRQKKDSNLIIRFSAPRYAEVRIPIKAYIRSDVVFDPGLIQFGNVELGQSKTAKVNIRYAGRNDWDIVDVKIGNPHLSAERKTLQRTGGRMDFELSVTLDDSTKAGRIRDLVTLVTNDKANPYVPLMVEGKVVPDFTVSPAQVNFRRIKAGSKVSQRIVVKGQRPFKIETVDCDGMSDCFEARIPQGARPVHVVPIQFSAPQDAGAFEDELVIQIAGRTEPLRLKVMGMIN